MRIFTCHQSPHKYDMAGAKIAIWGSDSLACLEPRLATCDLSNNPPTAVNLSLRTRRACSRAVSDHLLLNHQSQCDLARNFLDPTRRDVFGQGCESRPWVFGMRRSLCQPSLVLTLTDSKYHQRLPIHRHPRPGAADPSARETTYTHRGPRHRPAHLPVM